MDGVFQEMMAFLFLFLIMSAWCKPELVEVSNTPDKVRETGVDARDLDSVGLLDCKDLGLPFKSWKGVLYSDYAYMVKNVACVFNTSTLAEMATYFLILSAEPPRPKGDAGLKSYRQGAMLAERMEKLLGLGHIQYAVRLWNLVCATPVRNAGLRKAHTLLCVYSNKVSEVSESLKSALENSPQHVIEEHKDAWNQLETIVKFLSMSDKEARVLAEAQRHLMSDGPRTLLKDIHKLILTGDNTHFSDIDPFLLKLILKFSSIDKDFVADLSKRLYPIVYYDDAWKALDDGSKGIILEQLAKTGAIGSEKLANFYAYCDSAAAVPYDRRGVEGAQDCVSMNDPLARAALYKDLRRSTPGNVGQILARFMCAMARAGLLMAVLPELRRFVQSVKPSQARKKWAPIFLFVGLLCEDVYSEEELEKWLELAADEQTSIPAVPAYVIYKQDKVEHSKLKKLFVRWYQAQERGPNLQKALWVLARATPWLPKLVSLPHFTQACSGVLVDAALEWAVASEQKVVMLGCSVRSGVVPMLAVRPALDLKAQWGYRLAVECMLR